MPKDTKSAIAAAKAAGYSDSEIQSYMMKSGFGMQEQAQQQATQSLKEKITKGPEAQGQDLMASLSGHSKYPSSEADAGKQLRQTTAGYAGAVAPMYVPGPGKGNLLVQIAKGAAIGGGLGATERAVSRAGQGQLPDVSGTLKAAGTGAALGGIAAPLSEIPGVNRYLRGTKIGRMVMPEAAAAGEEASLAGKVAQGTQATPNIESAYKDAGLYTPYSSAQETGMWHAGQGATPSPYETELGSLTQRMRAAGVLPESAAGRKMVIDDAINNFRPAPGQGSSLVDPTTFGKGYKPR